MRLILPIIILLLTQGTMSVRAQFFDLETSYEGGRYTYTFSDGLYPIAFGVSQGIGAIYFIVPDATEISVPDYWLITYQEGGFVLAYDGVIETYPLGYEPLTISFSSELSIEEIGDAPGNWSGLVGGPVVLETGTATGILGYQSFYFDMPAYEGPQLTAHDLVNIHGFNPEDIQPAASEINVINDEITIYIGNIIEGATYQLQFKKTLTDSNWVNLFTFTSEDLDTNGCMQLIKDKEQIQGFFQVIFFE